MGYLFRLQIRKVGISLVEVYERVGKSVIWVVKGLTDQIHFISVEKVKRTFSFCTLFIF